MEWMPVLGLDAWVFSLQEHSFNLKRFQESIRLLSFLFHIFPLFSLHLQTYSLKGKDSYLTVTPKKKKEKISISQKDKRLKSLKVEEDIDRELEWNQRNLFEKWLLDALDIEKEQENKDKIFSVLLKLDWKCGDWCEDPVKREKERCSGSYWQDRFWRTQHSIIDTGISFHTSKILHFSNL